MLKPTAIWVSRSKNSERLLEEAEASYTQAIALKPDLAEAYSNLGITLQELGRLEEALVTYNKAIDLKADYAEAYSNKYLCLNYFSSYSLSFIFEQHLEFEKQFGGLQAESFLSLEVIKTQRSDCGLVMCREILGNTL